MTKTKFSGAVLAGGRSSRMGTDKAFLRIDGEALLHRQLRLLRRVGAGELIVSGRIGVDYGSIDATVVVDAVSDAGPLAGVAAVLEAADCEIVLVLAVDMPEMAAPVLTQILASAGPAMGCIPVIGENYEPLAAAYPKCLLPTVNQQLAKGQRAMRALVREGIDAKMLQTIAITEDEQNCFANWNRPEDRAL